jgi:hypothetical protein
VSDSDLLAAVLADPQAAALAAAGNDAGCAARLAAVLPPVPDPGAMVTTRLILKAFADPADGAACLDAFKAAAQANPVYAWVYTFLSPSEGGVDFGLPQTQAALDGLPGLTAAQKATLKALGQRPARVTADDVSRALAPRRPNGRLA